MLDWNAIAASLALGSPFNQARVLATTQLAVFEAVNAIEKNYEPYLGTVVAPAGASADAAAIVAAHAVLKFYAPPSAVAMLDTAKTTSLAAIPDGPAKAGGIATVKRLPSRCSPTVSTTARRRRSPTCQPRTIRTSGS